ncbi:MAG: aminotransferase class I/II-fold pyridoxal phosphate-dependent enzyme [Gemmatimonadaceae bacterium]|nr:aminotransferase class I/II-fold pyridoxal phosphate-dependent enzyme [Gemmatimonadaceae bacterium]
MIDLRSDTVTRPTAAMRSAMANAEVGDDVLDGDPTVRALETEVAALLGKDAALFFPSGTMANQTAIWLLAEPGTEALCDARSHIVDWEFAGAAVLRGVQMRTLTPLGETIRAIDVERGLRAPSRHAPRATLLCIENTHNGAGGMVTPLPELQALAAAGRAAGLNVHMDGARLWNAHTATGAPLHELAAVADTVMVSFSKGLGAPIGAALAGPKALIDAAWEVRKRFGGGMRQAGIIAAAALHGVHQHLSRLHLDHDNARTFAHLVAGAGGARVVAPDTNIVMFDLRAGQRVAPVVAAARAAGVAISDWSPTRIRAVFHLDVSAADATSAGHIVAAALAG